MLSTSEEVLDHLVGLVGYLAATSPTAWFTFLDGSGRVVPVAVPFDALPWLPTAAAVDEITEVVSVVLSQHTDGLQVLLALCRPAGGGLGPFERRWASALWTAADQNGWTLRLVAAVGSDRAREVDRAWCT